MTEKSIIIVGAGVAGLCAGIYGQMNGYKTHIFEMHKIPGGLLTAWNRQGYVIDLCIHWLPGSGEGIFLQRYWNEIGLLEGRQFLPHDRIGVFQATDGRVVNFYCDPDRLEKHLLEISPQDKQIIRKLTRGVRLGIRFNPPEMEKYESGRLAWMKFILQMMPMVKDIQMWTNLTVGELADRFQSSLIKTALNTVFLPESSVFYMILSQMGFMIKKQAGYPMGGSLPLALTLENRYKQLGGQITYQARVDKILVEHGRAIGAQFADGGQKYANVLISAADGRTTIFKLLGGKFTDAKVINRYKNWAPFQSLIFIGVGVRRMFPGYPYSVEGTTFELNKPVRIAGEDHQVLPIRIRNEDPTFAPPGKTVLTSAIFTSYEYWKALVDNPTAYEKEKESVVRVYLEALEQVWPGISQDVEMVDVSTPLTFERYTGNYQGSITGWKMTPEQATRTIPRKLPGLDNFWMIGQWVYPGGGLPAGVSTAREVIWRQCKKDRITFNTGR